MTSGGQILVALQSATGTCRHAKVMMVGLVVPAVLLLLL
jgi:hypothetical protein